MANFWQTLRGSFSAVSKPNFAIKYSFDSSWRDLQDLHAFAPLSIQNFSQISSNVFAFSQSYFQSFTDFSKTLSKLHEFWWKFSGISASFMEKTKIWLEWFSNFLRFRNGNCRIFQKMIFEKLENKKKLEKEVRVRRKSVLTWS